jgi:AraC family transcriptional regulator of arabinose operon
MVGTNRMTARPWIRLGSPGTWLMTYTTAGSGTYRAGSTRLTTAPGDLVLIHRDAAVDRCVPERFDWHYVHFDPERGWAPPAPFTSVAPGLYRARVAMVHTRQRIEDAFRRLIADVRARDAAAALLDLEPAKAASRRGAVESRRKLALAAVAEILLLLSGDALETAALDPRVVAALDLLTRDLAARHDAAAIARTAGLSTSRFTHLFREQLGVPMRVAVRTLRLQQAAQLLAYGSEPVGRIAEAVGFSSIYVFSADFRRAYGVSPRAYRALFRTLSLPPRSPGAAPRSIR